MVDIEKEKTKGEEIHEEIQRIRYVSDRASFAASESLIFRFLTLFSLL